MNFMYIIKVYPCISVKKSKVEIQLIICAIKDPKLKWKKKCRQWRRRRRAKKYIYLVAIYFSFNNNIFMAIGLRSLNSKLLYPLATFI